MKTFRMSFIAILIGLQGSLLWAQPASNPIRNDSFERGRNDQPAGWNTQTWGGSGQFEYASVGRTGSRSVKISSTSGADISWSQNIRVKPETEYRLVGWIKTDNVRGARGALLNLHNIQSVMTPAVTGTKDWTKVECRFNTGANDQIQINCLFGGWGLSTGTAWYDDIELIEVPDKPLMYYSDTSSGQAFAKDPDVARFKGKYWMYYTMDRADKGIAVGIAQSDDLTNWKKVGEMLPDADDEKNGLGAPAAIVHKGKVHLFYQTYGNGPKDAICHAWSEDGLHFTRNKTNPIFRPTGSWNCGRAIDADVIAHGDRMLLYWATRDPDFKTQMVGVASAPLDGDFARDKWKQLGNGPVLRPQMPWEKQCIEAPSVVRQGNKLFMFYAGAYNNQPQQIGCAVSEDGVQWQRLSDYPILPNGKQGKWNSSESGHPGIFVDDDGTQYLFFQGNNDGGKTWYLSKMLVRWDNEEPYLMQPRDEKEYRLRKTQKAVVRIDAAKTQAPVSEYIYGQFIEHLGRCIYGGIWAEMLEDRKFFYAVPAKGEIWGRTGEQARVLRDSPWKVIGPQGSVGMIDYDAYVGKHTPQITVNDTPAGIYQEELGIVPGKTYLGRVVLAGDPQTAPIHVSLVWGPTKEDRDTTVIERIGSDYGKYSFSLKAGKRTDEARLEIVGTGKGKFRIGAVSLMPGDNVNGFRADTL
ncbi:MAG: family 43 glycosylhydrolase, partial [Sedimentisphaerales bacterium]|nr:family 43 glycosylhydrolase [Sedimentisphaerales bacterium]